MSTTHDACTFVAVSNTAAKICCLDSQGKPSYPWQESGQQLHGSVNWLKNGKAFLTTQGGNVVVHVLEKLKDTPHTILSLPAGPLLARVGGDGKCLVVVQSSIPGAVHVYDIQTLLGAVSGAAPAKPPVVLQDHDRPILALAASTATTHVASSNAAGSVYLHDAGAGARSTLGPLSGGPALMTPKRCLAFSQTSKPLRLAAGADDGQVLVWQIAPAPLGPIAMHTKLRGRVMGVGFAAYNRVPATVLVSCSESGQLAAADMRNFPNVQATFSVELNVSVSCMAVREDGLVVAVGAKDGRIGLLRVDDLISHKQNLTKMGLIRVFNLDTHLDVVDLAFQRVREPRESRDAGLRDSRESPQPSTSTQQQQGDLATPQHQQAVDGPDGSQRQGLTDIKQEPPGVRPPGAPGANSAAGGLPGQRTQAPPGSRPLAVPPSGPVASSSSGPPGSASGILVGGAAQQHPPGRAPAVPTLVIPPASGAGRRQSDMGGGGPPSALATGGPGGMEDGVGGMEGSAVASPPAARAVGGAAGASPVASPSRPRSPRATLSGGGFPPGGIPRLPMPSTGGDALVSGLKIYLDDMRQETRDMVRGLQVDMVRQFTAASLETAQYVAALQQENRQLREDVQRLSRDLETALRFGLISQQRGPW